MSEQAKSITYDYKTVKARRDMEVVVCDSYQVLGWELTSSSVAEGSPSYVNLSFKRDRKIANKIQLLKEQEKIDNNLSNIDILQISKKSAGWTAGVCLGILGTLVFGSGMSIIMTIGGLGGTIAGVVLGVAGAGVVCLAHFLRKLIRHRKVSKINPILEVEFDKLAEACEKAGEL